MKNKKITQITNIIQAAQERKNIWPGKLEYSKRMRFELHAHETLTSDDAQKVNNFINWLEDTYKIELKILGGGWGCTKFVFEIQSSEEEGKRIISDILSNEEFKEKAIEAKFKLFVIPKNNQRVNIEAIKAHNVKKDKSVNISDIKNSQIQVESDNSHQQQTNNTNENLASILDNWKEVLMMDTKLPEAEKEDHVSDIEILYKEIRKSTPRATVINTILSSLGSVASLAALIHQIHPYLPTFS